MASRPPIPAWLASPSPRGALLFLSLLTLCLWATTWGLPALEDDKFWWIPQGLIVAERGFHPLPAGTLPSSLLPAGLEPPPQWSGGIPDYGHPPLFYFYLGVWYRLFGPGMPVTHLALLPLALLTVLGTWRLVWRLTPSQALPAAAALAISPVVLAQLARADLDLALLALTPWALEALLARRPGRAALLASLATLCKEPGILLAIPLFLAAWQGPQRDRLQRLGVSLLPAVALLGWGLWHRALTGWALAEAERLPPNLPSLISDLGQVTRFVLFDQGRVVLSLAVAMALVRKQLTGNAALLAAHLAAHLLFFGSINFLGGDPLRPLGSHWRYLLPALPSLFALGALSLDRLPRGPWVKGLAWLALAGLALLDWHALPKGGVERNLFAHDSARLHHRLYHTLRARLEAGDRVWVGTYAWLDYSAPAVGLALPPLSGLRLYGPQTDTAQLRVGDWVLESAHGEPLGTLSQDLALEPVLQVQAHQAVARLLRVTGPRAQDLFPPPLETPAPAPVQPSSPRPLEP